MKAWKKGVMIGGLGLIIFILLFSKYPRISLIHVERRRLLNFTYILSSNLLILVGIILATISQTKPTSHSGKGFRLGLMISAIVYFLLLISILNEGPSTVGYYEAFIPFMVIIWFFLPIGLGALTGSLYVIGVAFDKYTLKKYTTRQVGATVGGVWGLFSFFILLVTISLEEPFIILGVVLALPFYMSVWLNENIFFGLFDVFLSQSFFLFIFQQILIGAMIGLIIGYAIEKYKQRRSS